MNTYKARYIPEYINTLKQKLSLESIKNDAIAISGDPRVVNGREYTHCVRIDFIGIAATTLFDTGKIAADENVFSELVKLLVKVKDLNEEGYFVKLRFLLEYPYAVSAYTRIQAEHSIRRASINHPGFLRDFRLSEQVDEEIFNGSSYVRVQKDMLRNIQELYKDLHQTDLWNNPNTLNSFVIRFTPVQPGMCCLFINNSAFFDVYLLAKFDKREDRCKAFCPVIQLDKEDSMQFAAFEDHFRYLWDLDITMDCEDATHFNIDVEDSLSKVKPPNLIQFDVKGRRLEKKIEETGKIVATKDLKVWQSGINRIMNRLCANLSPTPSSESIFITCSWKNIVGNYNPNQQAEDLYSDLLDDLVQDNSPISVVTILEATLSESLDRVLYKTMQDSTIGIVLLTKDIEGIREDTKTNNGKKKDIKYYSKPNVYHELGYMMSHLSRDRILILTEKDVEIPSNIQDITRLEFESGKLCLKYKEIILHLKKITHLDDFHVTKIMESIKIRLGEKVRDKIITVDELNVASQKIDDQLNKITN